MFRIGGALLILIINYGPSAVLPQMQYPCLNLMHPIVKLVP